MRYRNEGAKEARKIIKAYQECLNSPRLVPEQCYRPNHGTYTLVHYINQITGLYLSKNYRPIPIFIQRAFERLSLLSIDVVSEPYRKIAYQYLAQMSYFILQFECFDEYDESIKIYIPEELAKAGEQPMPAIGFLSNEF